MKCFGFEKGPTIETNETVKKVLNDGTIVVMFMSGMAFVCCESTVASTEVRAAMKLPVKRDSSSKGKGDTIIASEINNIKELLQSIKNATDANTAEIAEIKSLSTKTNANVEKVNEHNVAITSNTQTNAPAMKYVNEFRSRALARGSNTPTSSKRKRDESSHRVNRENVKFPTPKVGTKTNVGGLSVVPKRDRKNEDKIQFPKALCVSRLNPTTEEDNVIEYITSNTPVTDKSKMKVHKMVKKGADLSVMNYVSFKVELNESDFDILKDESHWPEHVTVREFYPKASKISMGDHLFPALNDNSKRQATTSNVSTNAMETQ